jgi:nitrogen-specific signal transduction histidine kinase
MHIINEYIGLDPKPSGADYFSNLWNESWTYIKTVVDVVEEPILILDKDLKVIAANETFYETFQVTLKDTEGKSIYELGNGQWNIESLQSLLGGIMPKQTFFKGFQVAHDFPTVGRRVMILNARQIHVSDRVGIESFPPVIALAMEDVTDVMIVAESLALHTKQVEARLTKQTKELEARISELESDKKNRTNT